ncbi:MAG: methylmalonyl Co-A mutase-associated GTPase MeaB, partial [Chloroflexi bacterium HGW-Chloroflexi-7]
MKSLEVLSAAGKLALSRLISEVENETSAGRTALDECFSRSGKAHLIGVTGAPGTGKSSLVNRLAQLIRREGNQTVAIVANDPSSPFTGGAILGDRVRMRDLS